MGDDDHGDPPLPVDLLQKLQDGIGGGGIQCGGSLVTQQHLRVRGQSSGNGDALLLTAGQLHRVGVGLIRQAHDLQQLHGPLPGILLGNAHQLQGEADVIQGGALLQQVEALEDHGDLPPLLPQGLVLQVPQILAVEQNFAIGGPFQQVDAAHQGALACTGQADDTENLPGLDCQRDIVQCRHLIFPGAEHLG